MKNYSSENFLMELNNINWFQVTDIEDVNKAWALFHNLFIKVLNRVAPIKQVRLKQRSEPWMDGHSLDSIREIKLYIIFEKVKLLMILNISPNCVIKCNTLSEKLKDIFIITKLKIIKIPHQTFGKH